VLPFDGELVDLSLPLAEDLPCAWPTHQPYARTLTKRHEVDGYHTAWLQIDEHTGTHVDAPSHSLDGGGSIDELPLPSVVGPARVVGVTDLRGTCAPGESPLVGKELIERHERDHGSIEAGTVVLLHTAWDRHFAAGAAGTAYVRAPRMDRSTPGWPAPDVPAIELLLDRGVRCLGTDAPTIGPLQDAVNVHRAGLAHGMAFVEGLTALERLPPRGAFFVCLPLKVVGGSAAPARAVAFLPAKGDCAD
jgi:kynurenine formamidase